MSRTTSHISCIRCARSLRRIAAISAAAAAAVIVVGGIAVVAQRDDNEPTVVASAELAYDPVSFDRLGADTAAHASLVDEDGMLRIEVDDSDLPNPSGESADLELWLIEPDAVLEPMPSRSTQPTDVGHDSIAEQNAIDRPVNVSFSPDFAQMHVFRVDQHPPAPVRVLGLARVWVGAQDVADVALSALGGIQLPAARYQHLEFAFHRRQLFASFPVSRSALCPTNRRHGCTATHHCRGSLPLDLLPWIKVYGPIMEISLLYFDDCPNWRLADQHLAELAAEHPDLVISRHLVETIAEAERVGFRGSPSILVDGVDVFADPNDPVGLSCRVYQTTDGPAGSPTLAELRKVIASQ